MADTKISALTDGTAALGTDRFPVARDPFGAGDNAYLTLTYLGTYFSKNTLAAGTLTDSAPMTLTQTWSDAAEAFTGLKVNITDTNSDSASLLVDLQVAAASKFSVSKAGVLTTGSHIQCNGGQIARADAIAMAGEGFYARAADGLHWSSDTTWYGTRDIGLWRDAAGTLALRTGTASQTFNFYDTYTSSTDYHRVAIKTARATLASVSGATVTATSVIPDGAVVVGVTSKVTVGLGAGNGTTGYQVGTVADPDRWGAAATITAGTSTDNTNWTAGTIEAFTAASDVVVTAVGGNFDGTGTIYVSVQYLIGQCD
jgi:hypothetical protein